ncbi:hypothetical protein J6590_102838, partial [Homalodisca vitripennis]
KQQNRKAITLPSPLSRQAIDNTRQMRAFVRVRTSVTWDSPQYRPPGPGLDPGENASKA